jgi:hypothetical protein
MNISFKKSKLSLLASTLMCSVYTTNVSAEIDYGFDSNIIMPSDHLELINWYLSVLIDNQNEKVSSVKESVLSSGYGDTHFYMAFDASMILITPIERVNTITYGTQYTSAELREMLRRDDTYDIEIDEDAIGQLNHWEF